MKSLLQLFLLTLFFCSTLSEVWRPEDQLLPPESITTKDFYGAYVDISGDYVVVSAFGERTKGRFSGAAYIYKFNAVSSDYDYETTLWANDEDDKDRFGISVAIDGTTGVVGA